MKRISLVLIAFLFCLTAFAEDKKKNELLVEAAYVMGDCGDCVESEMDAPTGATSPAMGVQARYDISSECDESLNYDWSWRGELTIISINRDYIIVTWDECPSSGSNWIAWGRELWPCSAESAQLTVDPQVNRPATPSGNTNPNTTTYYTYTTTEPVGADSYEWTITGGDYDTTGATDESSIQIRFNDSSTSYSIKVKAIATCDESSWNTPLSVTTQ